jgi:cell division protein FtsB
VILDGLNGMNEYIETNFTDIKDILQNYKDEVTRVVTNKNEKEIAELKKELKAKEAQINNLK